jgi:hypothetical protein
MSEQDPNEGDVEHDEHENHTANRPRKKLVFNTRGINRSPAP